MIIIIIIDMEKINYDRAQIKVIETGEGFLKAKITIARPGVFAYFDADGKQVNEAKLPDEIFSPETIESARGIPITDDHPKENGEHVLINSENYDKYAKGNISEPRVVGDKIEALATIYDAKLIEKIKKKKQNEASIGFRYLIDSVSGNYQGILYDVIQRKIRINHVALVSEGRAGQNIKIHLDKRDNTMSEHWILEGEESPNFLTYRKFDGTDVRVSEPIMKELKSYKAEATAYKTDSVSKDEKIASLEKENAELKESIKADSKDKDLRAELDTAKEAVKSWKEKFDSLEKSIPDVANKIAKERVELITYAKSVDKEMKFDSLSNREIKLQIIAKGLPFKDGVRIDEQSDSVIDARFDASKDLLDAKAVQVDTKQKPSGIDRQTVDEKKSKLRTVYQDTRDKE